MQSRRQPLTSFAPLSWSHITPRRTRRKIKAFYPEHKLFKIPGVRLCWRRMKNVTLRQLRVFAAAARHMNFSRAAEELHLSQPAVSTQIKEIASHVGLPLFERIGRKTFLTPAGEEMLQCARAITQRIKEADEALSQLKWVTGGGPTAPVTSAGDYFFPRV